jgi:hypothetical protein
VFDLLNQGNPSREVTHPCLIVHVLKHRSDDFDARAHTLDQKGSDMLRRFSIDLFITTKEDLTPVANHDLEHIAEHTFGQLIGDEIQGRCGFVLLYYSQRIRKAMAWSCKFLTPRPPKHFA